MKAIITAILIAASTIPGRAFVIHEIVPPPMPQPPAPIGLGLGLNWCIGFIVVAATGYILHRCGAEYYLCISKVEGEDVFWFVSQGTVGTLAKMDAERCRGPFSDRSDPDLMAAFNNAAAATNGPLPFPCAPLATKGGPAPRPVKQTMQQSQDGGRSWASIATVTTTEDDGAPFGLLPPTGTNGMSRAAIAEFSGCSMLVTNAAGDYAIHRVMFEQP